MQTFKDNKGRDWSVSVTVLSIERVRAAVDGVNLLAVVEDGCDLMGRLANEPLLLFRTLYTLCKPQLDAAGVSDEAFSDALVGKALGDGWKALMGAIADFYPDPQRGQAIRTLVEKSIRVGELVIAEAATELEGIDPVQLASRLLTKLRSGSGSSPASSASTPDPSPSAS